MIMEAISAITTISGGIGFQVDTSHVMRGPAHGVRIRTTVANAYRAGPRGGAHQVRTGCDGIGTSMARGTGVGDV